MKLQNKKTGEIVEAHEIDLIDKYVYLIIFCAGDYDTKQYNSLAELNEEWEDYEEPEEHWAIDQFGEPINVTGLSRLQLEKLRRYGNDFPSEDATIKAIERCKAWTRLKEKGFRFRGLGVDNYEIDDIKYEMKEPPITHDCQEMKDLKLLFGGEDE